MMKLLLVYDFLVLDMLLWLPWLLIYVLRPDLRQVLYVMGILSIPFAFTEFLFYPAYWQPHFLWNLADHIGFGIEDVLFVIPLGGVSSAAYATIFGKEYRHVPPVSVKLMVLKIVRVGLLCGGLVGLVALTGIPMIFGAISIMIIFFGGISWFRKDLFWPGILGGCACTGVYFGVLALYQQIYPGIFTTVWNTINFMNIFFLGIPIEEVLYGFACGLIATVFYPFLLQTHFQQRGMHA